jgi:prepilin-type N-terminal cleavage/methylation domain-containing protein
MKDVACKMQNEKNNPASAMKNVARRMQNEKDKSTFYILHSAFLTGGFTLIEIMLVLALIAILSSITMPSIRGFAASTRLKSSARAIRDLLHFTRDMAITERTGYLAVFDLDQNRYWLASSESFDVTDPSGSSIASASNRARQAPSQQIVDELSTEEGRTILSRTGSILGIPQEPSHNVSLVQMTTNHNLQSNQIESGADYVYFSPTGVAEDAVIYIQDQRGEAMSITVEKATGRVRLQHLNRQQGEELGIFTDSQRMSR